MRIYLQTTPNTTNIPFDYQHLLASRFHAWLGDNEVHDEISLYSLSWLIGGKKTTNGLNFPKGAIWHISSYDEELLKRIIKGIRKEPEIGFGLVINDIVLKEPPDFKDEVKFWLDSPVLIKRLHEGEKNETHYTFENPDADALLTETMKSKLRKADKENLPIHISFDRSYTLAKTKIVNYKGISNKANFCPVIINGDPEAISFAWNVGIGNSTGIGFGALR